MSDQNNKSASSKASEPEDLTSLFTVPPEIMNEVIAKMKAEDKAQAKRKWRQSASAHLNNLWLNLRGKGVPTGHKPKKPWLWIFGALSAFYIFIEFSFNAQLVNFASSVDINAEDLDFMARKGEVLSGLGMMLLLMGFADKKWGISKRFGVIASILLMTGIGYFSVQFMTWAQPAIVESIVSRSSAEDRAKALNMTLFKHGAAKGSIIFDGKTIGEEPRDKVLLALLGPMAFANEQAQQKLFSSQEEIIKNLVLANSVDDKAGWDSYLSIRQSIRSRYDDYIKQAGRAHDARGGSPDEKVRQSINQLRAASTAKFSAYQKASNNFKRQNPRHTAAAFQASVGYPPDLSKPEFLVNPKVCSESYAEMHRKGIKVPSGWCPLNEGAVGTAVINQSRQSVDTAWDKRSKEMFGQVVSKNLSENQFRALPTIKRSISQSLADLPCVKGNAYLSAAQFRNQCVLPDLNKGLNSLMETYKVDVHKLADGGEFEARGKTAVRALVIPPVAIFFSLFFSLFALTRYFGRYRAASVAALIFVPMLLPMANSEIADFLLASGSQGSSLSGMAIKWVMTVEPAIYSVSKDFANAVDNVTWTAVFIWEEGIIPLWQAYGLELK